MKIVIDTNVLVSGIFWGGVPSAVLDLWAQGSLDLAASPPILAEYTRVLEKYGAKLSNSALASQWVYFIVQHALIVRTEKRYHVCRDSHDDMYLDCAVEGKAVFIVSGDKDLLVLTQFMGVKIIAPSEFLKRFRP